MIKCSLLIHSFRSLLQILTGHWLLMDAMGMGLCVAFIAFVRLPSLKVSTLLLMGLLIYDVFWVFFSSYIFNSNVMVRVATRPAENPVGAMAKRFHMSSLTGSREPPKLSLPGKLIFPSMNNTGHFSMLGLGDVVSIPVSFSVPFVSAIRGRNTSHPVNANEGSYSYVSFCVHLPVASNDDAGRKKT